jgi:hypothetical protein
MKGDLKEPPRGIFGGHPCDHARRRIVALFAFANDKRLQMRQILCTLIAYRYIRWMLGWDRRLTVALLVLPSYKR